MSNFFSGLGDFFSGTLDTVSGTLNQLAPIASQAAGIYGDLQSIAGGGGGPIDPFAGFVSYDPLGGLYGAPPILAPQEAAGAGTLSGTALQPVDTVPRELLFVAGLVAAYFLLK